MLELSLREALSLGHNYIGTEHVLLGLARENEGVASRILLDFDADADRIRDEVVRALSSGHVGDPPSVVRAPDPGVARRVGPRPRSPWEALAPPLSAGFGLAIGILLGWLIWG